MSEQVQLVLAGIGIEVTWDEVGPIYEQALQFYEPFHARQAMDLSLHVHCGSLPSVKAGELLFDALENRWRLWQANGRYLFEIFDTQSPHPKAEVALLDSSLRAGEVYILPNEFSYRARTWSLARLMRPLVELLIIHHLAQRRQGVMVHGLGIEDRGRGLLFVGASGAGKTTLANLYANHSNARILGDERLIVKRQGGGFVIGGTPWPGGGFQVSAGLVPLHRIFFLEHAPRNVLIPDGLTNLFSLLFQQLFLSFWHRENLDFALQFADELLTSVPATRLGFVNTAEVISFLQKEVFNGSGN